MTDDAFVPAPGLREVAEVWWDDDHDPVVRWSSDGRRYLLTDADGTHELLLADVDGPVADPVALATVLADGLAACDFPPTGDGASRSRVQATLRAAGRRDVALTADES